MLQPQKTLGWKLCMLWLVISSYAFAGIRLWCLNTAFDAEGLPVASAPAALCLLLAGILALGSYLAVAFVYRPRCSAEPERATAYTPLERILELTGAALVLIGVATEYYAAPGISGNLFLLPFGILGGVSLLLTAVLRTRGTRSIRATALLAIVYVLLRLLVRFKVSWSLDPQILDYCIPFFALIFSLCGMYFDTGALFGISRPRLTCFFCCTAACFCLAAAADGYRDLGAFGLLFWLGMFIRFLAPVSAQLAGSEA